MAQARSWCFTLNNPTDEDCIRVMTMANQRYIIVGNEEGENGTPHFQGYIMFHTPWRFRRVKEYIGERAHIEKARGNPMQNIIYCSKQEIFFEKGDRPKQGRRNDLAKLREAVSLDPHISLEALREEATSLQGLKMADMLHTELMPIRDEPPIVTWIWGPTGSGKTRMAFTFAKDPWISGNDLRWWQGYVGQTDIIIDDFRADFCKFHVLLRYLDRYPIQVEVKGGSRWLAARKIWVTSVYHPGHVYCTREDINQLLRRITTIIELD